MAKDQSIFSAMHECNTKQIFVGDDRSLSVVGSGTVPVENGHSSDVLCVPKIPVICYQSIKLLIQVKVKL